MTRGTQFLNPIQNVSYCKKMNGKTIFKPYGYMSRKS